MSTMSRWTATAALGLLLLMLAAISTPARATARPPGALEQVGTVDLPGGTGGFGGAVDGFAIDPQGRKAYVALNAGGDEPSLQVIDISGSDPRIVGAVRDHTIGSLAASPDGTRLYAVYDVDQLAVFDTTSATPTLLKTVELSTLRPKLAISPDGRTLYVGDSVGVMHAISAYRLPQLHKLPFRPDISVDVSRLTISPDGRHLAATGSYDGDLVVADTATGAAHTVAADDPDDDDNVGDFVFTADGRALLAEVGTEDGMDVRRIDPRTGAVQRSRSVTEDEAGDIAVSPDGRYAYVSGADGMLRVLDGTSLRTVRRVRLPDKGSVAQVQVAPAQGTNYGHVVTVQDGDSLDDRGHPVLTVFEQRGLGEPATNPTSGPAENGTAAAPAGTISATPHESPTRLVLASAIALGGVATLAAIGVLYARGRL